MYLLTMAMNGPNEAPKTTTMIIPSFNNFTGEKSHRFTPKIRSCLPAKLSN